MAAILNGFASEGVASRMRRITSRMPTYLADARANPEWLAMFALARFTLVRRALWTRSRTELPTGPCSGSMLNVGIRDVVGALRNDGIFPGLQLPEEVQREIEAFARGTACFGNLDRQLEFHPSEHGMVERQRGHAILSGHYFDRVETCPAILRIRDDPALRAIAAGYLGDRARVTSTRLWWSFPAKGVQEADLHLASQERYHFDLDDWRTLKFFFYILPVDASTGPYVYVKRSHKRHILRHQFTLLVGHPAEEVIAAYGAENVLTLLGGPGCGFAEDSFGFHMGTVARQRPRLLLEVAFGISAASRLRFHGEPIL